MCNEVFNLIALAVSRDWFVFMHAVDFCVEL